MKSTLNIGKIRWINLASPTKEEISDICNEYEFHELIEEDLDEMTVQPKIDQYDDNIFVVLNFPKYNLNTGKYVLNEFDIVLGKDYIITFSRYEANHVAKIVQQYKADIAESDTKDEEAFKISPYYILYTIIDAMYDKMVKAQEKTSKDIIMLEQRITESNISRHVIADLMKIKANVVFLKYTFLPQKQILSELQKTFEGFYEGDLDVYFEDLESKLDKIINNSMILYETVQSLADTYDALMNIQTNTIIRVLTVLTAITWILTLISGFYGMNIRLPLEGEPYAWGIVGGFMLLLVLILIMVFRRKRWI